MKKKRKNIEKKKEYYLRYRKKIPRLFGFEL